MSCIAYGDVIGRLRCIFLGAVLSIIGLVLEASSYSLGQLIVARLVVGASIGVYSSTVPVWQAECSGTTHRGAFVVMEGCFISSGITLSEWISYGLFYASSTSIQWRITLAFPIIFSIVVLACLKFAPESPRWLLKKGRVEDARMVLSALRDEDPFANAINTEIGQIQASLQEVTGSLRELFRNTKERILHRTALAMMGQAMQQLCGISGKQLLYSRNCLTFSPCLLHALHFSKLPFLLKQCADSRVWFGYFSNTLHFDRFVHNRSVWSPCASYDKRMWSLCLHGSYGGYHRSN